MNWAEESYSPGHFDKSSVDILDVLVKVGGRVAKSSKGHGWWDDEVAVFCFNCSDATSRKPAGRANTTKGVYHCWSCGFGGDVISIAMKYLDADFSAAIKWLEAEFVQ